MPYYYIYFQLDDVDCKIIKWAETIKEAIEFVKKYYPEAKIQAVAEKD